MNRPLFAWCASAVASSLVLASCANGNSEGPGSLCTQLPTPPACAQTCDPTPGAPPSCPSGTHCSPEGKCDAVCTPSGGECGDGYTCSDDGACLGAGNGSGGGGPDAECPAVHVTATPSKPSIELIIDRSGSMTQNDIWPNRFQAIETALFGPNGAVTTEQSKIYFGATLFAGDQGPCLNLNGFTAPRALNNAGALQGLISSHPPTYGSTPTSPAIDAVVADFHANPPPMDSAPVILLATDGEPNGCWDNTPAPWYSINSAYAAHAAGIRLYIVGLAGLNTWYLQAMADAGMGIANGQPHAPYFTASDPSSLTTALHSIITNVLSCDLAANGHIDPQTAMGGSVIVNGTPLQYGTDWTVDPNGMLIHILGQACTSLKSSPNPTVDASFPCGTVLF